MIFIIIFSLSFRSGGSTPLTNPCSCFFHFARKLAQCKRTEHMRGSLTPGVHAQTTPGVDWGDTPGRRSVKSLLFSGGRKSKLNWGLWKVICF